MIVPSGAAPPPLPKSTIDNPILKAVVRAHRWQRLLEAGAFSCISELAAAEGADKSYASKVLRLTLLAPALVAQILDRADRNDYRLGQLLSPFPTNWDQQNQIFPW